MHTPIERWTWITDRRDIGHRRPLSDKRMSRRQALLLTAVEACFEPLERRRLMSGGAELVDEAARPFIANEGQWSHSALRYALQYAAGSVGLTDDGLVFRATASAPHERSDRSGDEQRGQTEAAEWRMSFDGANASAPIGAYESDTRQRTTGEPWVSCLTDRRSDTPRPRDVRSQSARCSRAGYFWL